MVSKSEIPWLPDDEYAKAIGQFRLQLNGVFEPFRQYGQDVYVPGAIREIVKLTEDFSLRVRGVDQPIDLDIVRRKQ
jgi:hypothetical protein